MAYTQSDLDALDAAIASGHRRVYVEGRQVEYASTAELLQARSHVNAQLNAAASTAGGTRPRGVYRFRFVTSRGD